MADHLPTRDKRICAICGATFHLNPRYSAAQKTRARYCSPRCAGRGQPHPQKTITELLGGETRFGILTVIGEGEPILGKGHPARRARCRCDCGNIRDVQPGKLKTGRHQSCGCEAAKKSRERFTKHGGYRTPEYKSWNAMMQRCTNPRNTSYAEYGGRGIMIAPQWMGPDGFLQFVADLGHRPDGMTLDRIKSDGNYEPGNVRWATRKVQQNNRQMCKPLTLDGLTLTQSEWTERRGWGKNVIGERLKKGWTVERALTEPVAPRTKRNT